MFSGVNQQPGPNTGETPFGELVIETVNFKTLGLDKVKLITDKLFDEFKEATTKQEKTLIYSSIAYLAEQKGVTIQALLNIHQFIEITKFSVIELNDSTCTN